MRPYKLYVRGYKGKTVFSKAIKWFTWGKYSHVSLVFHMGDRVEEIESIEGVGVAPPQTPRCASEHEFDELLVDLTHDQIVDCHIRFMSIVGSKYDKMGIVALLLRRNVHDLTKWICSEAVSWVLHPVKRISRRPPYKETPNSIMESYQIG